MLGKSLLALSLIKELIVDTEKTKLIKRIHELASLYDVSAKSEAIDAIRKHKDEKRMESARRYVLLADDRQSMAKDVIDAIHAYWPK